MYKLFRRTHVPRELEVQMAGACDPGMARGHNEDAIALREDDGCGFYLAIVCDGMGGANAGEVASAAAVEMIGAYIERGFGNERPESLLRGAFTEASQHIDEIARANPSSRGMGCTAVVALGIGQELYLANAGDSRAYRRRGSRLEQLSDDHTMVCEMVTMGLLSQRQADEHPYRGRISRCLGHGKNREEPAIRNVELERGDDILLCTDGLSDVVEDDEIERILSGNEVRQVTRRLIDAANAEGGPDNISAVVLRRVV